MREFRQCNVYPVGNKRRICDLGMDALKSEAVRTLRSSVRAAAVIPIASQGTTTVAATSGSVALRDLLV